mmetsp:Transcript_39763/g.83079  ORF Transcript_39763/g.83079 Transcript_39763/m.83079 type:complete len:167 (+) Transcript_39763:334-834(+)
MPADKLKQKKDISLLLDSQRNHRDDIICAQTLLELRALPRKICKHSFVPKKNANQVGIDGQTKRKSTINKKRPVFNSAKARIENNSSLSKGEKKQALLANEKASSKLTLKLTGRATIKGKAENSKWRMDSKELRDAIRSIQPKKKLNKGKNIKRAKRARTRSLKSV